MIGDSEKGHVNLLEQKNLISVDGSINVEPESGLVNILGVNAAAVEDATNDKETSKNNG